MTLKRDEILAADDVARKTVKVPEWGGEVVVVTMSGEQRDEWEQAIQDGKGGARVDNVSARLLAFCLVDDNGKRLFSIDDVTALGRKSSKVLSRLTDVAMRLNGLREADVEQALKN